MKKYIVVPIVLGVSAGLMTGEMLGEDKPHAEFVAVSPGPSANTANIAFTNSTSLTTIYTPESFTPTEWKIPHDRLVVQTAGLIPPTKTPTERT